MSLLARLLTLQAQTTVVPNLLYTWGDNASGQIGNSTIINRSTPLQIGTSYWTSIGAGESFTVAVRGDGTLWSWGQNNVYQLGLLDTVYRSSPVQVTAYSNWTAVAAGSSHAIAINSEKQVYTWGSNSSGQLGNWELTAWQGVHNSLNGGINTYFVRNDGTLWVCGNSLLNGQAAGSGVNIGTPTLLPSQYDWKDMQAGANQAYGIKRDGTLWTMGGGNPPSLVSTTARFKEISVGSSHVALISTDNFLYTFGTNSDGQLGTGNRTLATSPVKIGNNTWSKVTTGYNNQGGFTLALDTSGKVWAMGNNAYGDLGDSTRISRSSPVQINSTSSFTVISSGSSSAAITIDGKLFTWGAAGVPGNYSTYELGLGDTAPRSNPTQVGSSSWTMVSSGIAGSKIAITINNIPWGWGYNAYGELGVGDSTTRTTPTQLTNGISTAKAVECNPISIIIDLNNNIYTAGADNLAIARPVGSGSNLAWGVISNTGFYTTPLTPNKIQASGSWNLISAGVSHSIATDSNNKLWSWGGNTNYQLGLQDARPRSSPTQITTASSLSFTQISAGAEHNHALTNNGELYGWGKNSAGEVGMLKHRYNAVTFINGNWIAIDQQGYLWTCGSGLNAQNGLLDLTVPARSSPTQISTDVRYSAVQMSALGNTIALGADGSLWTWGTNSDGGLGSNLNGSQLLARSSPAQVGTDTNWSKIATKYYGGLAIKTDGSLWAWGAGGAAQGYLNQQGYSTISRSSPTQIGTSSWTMVSGGVDHVLAITVDGKLWGWGTNNQGQLGINATTARSSAVQISAGTSFIFCAAGVSCSYAIDTGYKLWAWGINTNGQLGISAGVASRSNPVQVSPYKATSFTQVFSQPSNAMAIDTDNNLWQFGLTSIAGTGIWPNASTSDPNILGAGTFTNAAAEAFPQLKYSWTPVGGGGNATQNRYAITTDGSLQMFGPNAGGQSGIFNMAVGTTPARSSPVQVNAYGVYPNIASPTRIDSKSYTSISSGTSTTVAIDSTSKLYTWGSNPNGQLGFYHAIRNVHLGYLQTYVLSNKGNIYMWGSNTGFLTQGTPAVSNRSFPVQVTNNTAMMPAYSRTPVFSKITALDSAIAGLDIYGKLWVWGRNGSDGPLGTNSIINRIAPVQINDKTYRDVSGQAGTTLYLIDSDYKLWVCGNNANGQLGTNDVPNRSSPVQLLASSSVSLVHGSRSTGLFMTIDGVLWGCGENGSSTAGSFGALLTGDTISRSSPVIVTSDTSWKLIKTGWNGENAAGIKNDDTLWVWGGNNNGQLGQNDRVERNSPVQIPGSWINIAWGYRGAMALRSDYTVWAWGQSIAGNYTYNYGASTFNRSSPVQLSVNGQFSFTQIDASFQTTAFVLTDGTLWMCGQNNQGGLGDNSILVRSSPVQVGAGTLSPLTTLLANEATNPVSISVQLGTDNWSKVADGRDFMLATRTNETLWAWGLNTSGQLGNNDSISRSSPVQISAPTTGSFTQIVAGATHAGFIFKPTT